MAHKKSQFKQQTIVMRCTKGTLVITDQGMGNESEMSDSSGSHNMGQRSAFIFSLDFYTSTQLQKTFQESQVVMLI